MAHRISGMNARIQFFYVLKNRVLIDMCDQRHEDDRVEDDLKFKSI